MDPFNIFECFHTKKKLKVKINIGCHINVYIVAGNRTEPKKIGNQYAHMRHIYQWMSLIKKFQKKKKKNYVKLAKY